MNFSQYPALACVADGVYLYTLEEGDSVAIPISFEVFERWRTANATWDAAYKVWHRLLRQYEDWHFLGDMPGE